MKRTSDRVSSLAAKVLRGYKPTEAEILILAASCLSQDEVAKIEGDPKPSEMFDSELSEGKDITNDLYGERNA